MHPTGSEWWDQIQRGERPTHRIEGVIEQVYWASMGDWPEFRIRAAVLGEEMAMRRAPGLER
jgi:hypothetical protein